MIGRQLPFIALLLPFYVMGLYGGKRSLKALWPVAVMIDEADAFLGNRDASGDSGTSSRVFASIASFMGNTEFRGKIVWFLLTCRPDLLPIDLKRQGRAEVHLPLFPPRSEAEVSTMIRAMAKKNRAGVAGVAIPPHLAERGLSGSDLESIVLSAKRRALARDAEEIGGDDLAAAVEDFIPSAQGMEKEMQELAAVLECTELHFLPPDWRARVADGDGRTRLQERLAALRHLVRE